MILFSIINHTDDHNVILNCLKCVNYFFPTSKIIIYSNNKDFALNNKQITTNIDNVGVGNNFLSEIFAHNKNIELAKKENIKFDKIVFLNSSMCFYTNHIMSAIDKFDTNYWPLNLNIINDIIINFKLENKIMFCDKGFFFLGEKEYFKLFELIKSIYKNEYRYYPFNIIIPTLLDFIKSKNYKLIDYSIVKRFINNDFKFINYNTKFTNFVREKRPLVIDQTHSNKDLIKEINKNIMNIRKIV